MSNQLTYRSMRKVGPFSSIPGFVAAQIFSLLLVLHLVACGANSENDPGLCKLSCAKSKIGDSVSMKVTPMFNTTTNWSCPSAEANNPFKRPLVMRFSVTTEVDGALYGKTGTVNVPAPGLSFNVITSGSVFYAAGTSSKNGNLGTLGFEPPEYTGVATPFDEWCTDSCGVLTVQVWPQCPGAGESVDGSVLVSSGSLSSGSVPISVTTVQPTALAPGVDKISTPRFEDLLNSFNRKLYHIYK